MRSHGRGGLVLVGPVLVGLIVGLVLVGPVLVGPFVGPVLVGPFVGPVLVGPGQFLVGPFVGPVLVGPLILAPVVAPEGVFELHPGLIDEPLGFPDVVVLGHLPLGVQRGVPLVVPLGVPRGVPLVVPLGVPLGVPLAVLNGLVDVRQVSGVHQVSGGVLLDLHGEGGGGDERQVECGLHFRCVGFWFGKLNLLININFGSFYMP